MHGEKKADRKNFQDGFVCFDCCGGLERKVCTKLKKANAFTKNTGFLLEITAFGIPERYKTLNNTILLLPIKWGGPEIGSDILPAAVVYAHVSLLVRWFA